MFRYKITVEYIGTSLVGWQRQDNGVSVQELLENAIFKFSNEQVVVYGAGRTDAGVHALGQVAHFNLSRDYQPKRVISAINYFLQPYLIAVIACEQVPLDFHARFSANKRYYLYRIIMRPGKVVIELDRVWWIRRELDIDAMRVGASYLVGRHDFTSFCGSSGCGATMRTIDNISVCQHGYEIQLFFIAKSFLYHMVRYIVGSLVLVGLRKWDPKYLKVILELQDRRLINLVAPACGLYLTKVDYVK